MKKVVGLTAGLVAAAGSIFVAAPAATAADVGTTSIKCNSGKSSSAPYYAFARCSNIGVWNYFRVRATCIDPRGNTWIANGPWVFVTQTSTVKCSDNPNVGILKTGFSFSNSEIPLSLK